MTVFNYKICLLIEATQVTDNVPAIVLMMEMTECRNGLSMDDMSPSTACRLFGCESAASQNKLKVLFVAFNGDTMKDERRREKQKRSEKSFCKTVVVVSWDEKDRNFDTLKTRR